MENLSCFIGQNEFASATTTTRVKKVFKYRILRNGTIKKREKEKNRSFGMLLHNG